MKTFEGTFTILWCKNCRPDTRPLTIDCSCEKELKQQIRIIKSDFMTKGDCKDYPLVKKENIGKIPYSITFDLTERI